MCWGLYNISSSSLAKWDEYMKSSLDNFTSHDIRFPLVWDGSLLRAVTHPEDLYSKVNTMMYFLRYSGIVKSFGGGHQFKHLEHDYHCKSKASCRFMFGKRKLYEVHDVEEYFLIQTLLCRGWVIIRIPHDVQWLYNYWQCMVRTLWELYMVQPCNIWLIVIGRYKLYFHYHVFKIPLRWQYDKQNKEGKQLSKTENEKKSV